MSTRATVHFHHGDDPDPVTIVYRHSDGYPEGLGADLFRFFEDVAAQTRDPRFSDPSYLAAKFVVWQAAEYTRGHPLDFLSVGVLLADPGDIQYRYHVHCAELGGTPSVTADKRTGRIGDTLTWTSGPLAAPTLAPE